MFMKRNIVVVGIITVVSGAMRAEDHSQNQLQHELAAVLKMGDTLGRFTCRFSTSPRWQGASVFTQRFKLSFVLLPMIPDRRGSNHWVAEYARR